MIQQTIFGSYEVLVMDDEGEPVVMYEGTYEECEKVEKGLRNGKH